MTNTRLNTDKLISEFMEYVKAHVEEDCPNNATQVLEELETRLHDIADEYMVECLVSSHHRRGPSKEELRRSFGDIYLEVKSECSEEQKEGYDWWLTNGEERNCQHPTTFEIPSAETRHTLRVGDLAKLGFEDGEGGERMWVLIAAIEDGRYIGTLDNYPVFMPLHFGQRIEFLPEHVIDVETKRQTTKDGRLLDHPGRPEHIRRHIH